MGSLAFVAFALLALLGASHAQLKLGFYDHVCPHAESIVKGFVEAHVKNAPSLAPALIRMHFHDCFVRGCDASLLLNSTKNSTAEKDVAPNASVRGYDFIEALKSLIEEECPGVVSCADILTLAARDAIAAIGGPYWQVATGRRDGTVSVGAEVFTNMPAPTFNFSTLEARFAKKGLSAKDLIVLVGAHTIGHSHCSIVSNRLYNFTGKGDPDPSLDRFYADNLRKYKCKTAADKTTVLEMDPGSSRTFDNHYYVNVAKRRGLFSSDASLITTSFSKSYVEGLVSGKIDFFKEFTLSAVKLSQVDVKTGTEGEIRKVCSFVNH